MAIHNCAILPFIAVTVISTVSGSVVFSARAKNAEALKAVPFVGCRADGQTGPKPAPRPPTQPIMVPRSNADGLAYYATSWAGVLGPRGWHCFGLFGSNGETIYVSPEVDARHLFGPDDTIKGPAIQLTHAYGDTSGRFEVARVAARLFPTKKEYVQAVIGENIEPAAAFPFGGFPADQLTRKTATLVEYKTPAYKDGMGTMGRLSKNDAPIFGFARMNDDNDLIRLSVRLPARLRPLIPIIVRRAEKQ